MGSMNAMEAGFLRGLVGRLLGWSFDGRRDTYKQFGYPKQDQVTSEMLLGWYVRGGIASRIVRAFPQATWEEYPVASDDDGSSTTEGEDGHSPFAEAFEAMCENLKLPHYFERVDRLSGIGQYAVLLLGFEGGDDLSLPLESGNRKLLYLAPYAEINSKVNSLVQNTADARYGLPETYILQQSQPSIGSGVLATRGQTVHHSRVLHVAESLAENEIYGEPRLLPILNYLMDLEKVVGSSAETFWMNARPGLGLWADKEANLSPDDIKLMKVQAEEFEHQLRRVLVGSGMTAQSIAATVADPAPNVDALIKLIAGTTGIPQRILVGAEAGKLASAQDENEWNTRIDERRKNYATPTIIKPFIDKMVATGNLPKPQGQWWITWPERSASSLESAQIAQAKAAALRDYTSAGSAAELVIPQQEFRQWVGEDPVSNFGQPAVEDTASGMASAANRPDPALAQPLNENDPNVKAAFNARFRRKVPKKYKAA